MSHYTTVECMINDREAFIEALISQWASARGMTLTREDIEIHDEPTHLYGFQGDRRETKANIIIRRNKCGGASNDIGWLVDANGKATELISEFDRGYYTAEWSKKLKGRYGLNVASKAAVKKGYNVIEELDELGVPQLRCTKRIAIG